MTEDQEAAINRGIHRLNDEALNTGKNINFIGFVVMFIAVVLVLHVWHHW